MNQRESQRTGVFYGLAAYGWWGVVVVYFKWVSHVPPLELLAHRIVWSVLLLAALLGYRRRFAEIPRALRDPKILRILLASTVLVACNWFTFIWAVMHAKVVQASLGYFINPLVNVLLGFVFLRERLRPVQWASVSLACAGVISMTLQLGSVPVIALILAFSFGLYGLLRKIVGVESMVGLATETFLLLPAAFGYLLWLGLEGNLVFAHHDLRTDLLLVAAGIVTALPLLWFAHAARRLNLATVGFLQYLAPSLQLLIGVTIYKEDFTPRHAMSFGLIWIALAIYSVDAATRIRRYGRVRP
jgi:chloramphenicol-sensitive protein RarD